ncbi:hypothetical protein Tco_1062115, partial [Tanacetum coccineum]
VFSIWKPFGGNTRDLGSFGEETDKTMNLHQHLLRISTQQLETASLITRDAVKTPTKTASQDLKTATTIPHDEATTNIRKRERMAPNGLLEIKEAEKDDEDERLLSIFKQIHINLPFLEAMIHMPKGAKVLKDLLSQNSGYIACCDDSLYWRATWTVTAPISRYAGHGCMGSIWLCMVGFGLKHKEEEDSNKALAVSFYPRTEPVEPLKWKASENRLKPSSIEPPKLELKELPKHLEYTFLQENNQLPVVISSALSTDKKTRLLEVLQNHKGAIA